MSSSASPSAAPMPDPAADPSAADASKTAGGPTPEPSGQLPPQRQLSGWTLLPLGALLLVEAFACMAVLVSVWTPLTTLTAEHAPTGDPMPWTVLGLGPWHLTSNTAMLLAVLAASGLGSFVHAATSFATYAGNRQLLPSWLPWYLLRTAIGGALALLVYFLLRGGLFANGTDGTATNPYGFAGIAGLCGLFSKQATDKLREVFDTVLTTKDGAGDDERDDKIQPVPPAAPAPVPVTAPAATAAAPVAAPLPQLADPALPVIPQQHTTSPESS
ncbi:hypothetical protein [Kitasatospora sp. NPDC088783]|uniref:hypothetical protein n=1 Tax=Kitasatospora sp. NPDC088783 TaxID=3364077 RepID=UPI0038172B87